MLVLLSHTGMTRGDAELAVYSDISLLRHVFEHEMWKSIGKCWQTTLFARGPGGVP